MADKEYMLMAEKGMIVETRHSSDCDAGNTCRDVADARLQNLPAVGGQVSVELNAAITVSGTASVCAGELHFLPNLDARLVGRDAFSHSISEVVGLHRMDGGRRVCVSVGARDHVFRGEGAQRMWVALQVMRDSVDAPEGCEFALIEQDPLAPSNTGGLYGIAARGFGYAGMSSAFGTVQSHWHSFAALQGVRNRKLEVQGESVPLTGGGAGEFIARLPKAWLAAMPPIIGPVGPWAERAVYRHEHGFDVGTLMIGEQGVVFERANGRRRIVALRGALVRPHVDPRDPSCLSIEVGLDLFRFVVSRPEACVNVLDAVCLAPDWGAPPDETDEQALSRGSSAAIRGPARTVRLIAQGMVLAEATETLLMPGLSHLSYSTMFLQDPPPVPFAATLEIENMRGRFMVPGAVVGLRPMHGIPGASPGAPCMQISFRFTGEAADRNRREFHRLEVKESSIGLFRLAQDGRGELVEGKSRFMNISRRGCLVRMSSPMQPGEGVLAMSSIGKEHVALYGRVVHANPDGPAWLVGITFAEGSLHDAARYYNDREVQFLRRSSSSAGRWPRPKAAIWAMP
ncbi:MAG: PilZ domain-containing protein [Deltaproteobacteria bacterium]|nr:PilZ domain-containing protein [Deltaproteobacteria bacterium]